MTRNPPSLSHKRVIIVGAGQAGLAMSYSLMQKGLRPQEDFVLIDAAPPDHVAWTSRWHSLTLFTSAQYSALAGMAFPGDPNRYPRADEVAEYLREYADQMGLRPIWGTRALAVTPSAGGRSLTLRTSDGDFDTRNVVAATGPFSVPRLPPWAGGTVVPGINIHSSQYTHPNQIPQGTVLIVGAGNTGRQLARELSFSHDITLARGSTQPELPQRLFGRDVFAWLSRTGLLSFPVPPPVRGSLARREVVIGNPLPELRTLGVSTVGRVTSSSEGVFHIADSSPVTPTSVIWATGFEPGFDWLPGDTRNPDGHVVQRRGATNVAGLFVLGLPWMRSRGSALITGVSSDASHIARQIRDRP